MEIEILKKNAIEEKIKEICRQKSFEYNIDFFKFIKQLQGFPNFDVSEYHHNCKTQKIYECEGMKNFIKEFKNEIIHFLKIPKIKVPSDTINSLAREVLMQIKERIENAYAKILYTSQITEREETQIKSILEALKTLNNKIKELKNDYDYWIIPYQDFVYNFELQELRNIHFTAFNIRDKLPQECSHIAKIKNEIFGAYVIEINTTGLYWKLFVILVKHKKNEKIEIDIKILTDKNGTFYIIPSSNLQLSEKMNDLLSLPQK